MRLLVINYEMDEDSGVLAWQARVAWELAQRCDFVAVLTEKMGRFRTAANMHVELFESRPLGLSRRFGGALLLNQQVYQLCRRHQIDLCFIHMAADWAYYLYPTFRLRAIPVVLWYAHGTVSPRLRLAHACASRVVTSTPEGFRIPSNKVHIIGQGVDTELFQPPPQRQTPRHDLITVSRVSRRKGIDKLLQTMACLKRMPGSADIRLRVIGPLLTQDDLLYDKELRTYLWQTGLQESVEFAGFVPYERLPSFYNSAFLHINVSQTGSLDKTVVEALACGCPVLVSNEAFHELLAGYPEFIIHDDRPEAIAEQLLFLYHRMDAYDPQALRKLVVGKHDLASFIEKLMGQLRETAVA
jgi:glycosyltransferase involved in cell wall biosynthesis